MLDEEMDPYRVLGISYDAGEEEIQQAFQAKMLECKGSQSSVIKAYGMLRTPADRRKFRWGSVWSCMHGVDSEEKAHMDLEAIVKELAFLTAWELGEDLFPASCKDV